MRRCHWESALVGGACILLAGIATAQELRPLAAIRSPGIETSPASRKIGAHLRALATDFEAEGFADGRRPRTHAAERFSSPVVRVDGAGRVQVYAFVTGTDPATLAVLAGHGFSVELVNREFRVVQGWVSIDGLEVLAADPVVTRLRLPSYAYAPGAPRGGAPAARAVSPEVGAVTSAGDAMHRCDLARGAGFTGAGTTVGVISNGVDGLAAAQASSELPDVVVLLPGVADEGTAMLEIVHDCAPDAALLFHSAVGPDLAITSLSFMQAVDRLRDAGTRIIVDDIQNFIGEPYFEDGLVAQHDRSVGNAVVRVAAASNGALAHYQGTFRTGPSLSPWTLHDFGGGDTRLRFRTAAAPGGALFGVVLQWSNPFGAATDDYDLCIRNTSGQVVTCSLLVQSGNDDPLELVALTCTGPAGTVCLGDMEIRRFAGAPAILEALCFPLGTCRFDQFNSPQDAVFGHAAVPEVLAVAAIPAGSPSAIQAYSARGPATVVFPRPEIRFKPDLAAADCVATSRPGFDPFCGTSAAAPHAAGVAALLMQALGPSASPAEVRRRLKATTVDIAAAGADWDAGYGRVDAVNAIFAPRSEILPVSAGLPLSRAGEVGSTVTVFATIIADGSGTARGCSIAPGVDVPALFGFYRTSASNQISGPVNVPVDIPGGQLRTFAVAFGIYGSFPPIEVPLSVECLNTVAARIVSGVNTIALSGSSGPTLDVVALAATGPPNNGIVDVRGPSGTGVFAMATVNVGRAGGTISVKGETSGTLPVVVTVCRTSPATGACLAPASDQATTTVNPGQALTFAFFVTSLGTSRPFDPATDRVFARIRNAAGELVGATSVAVRWVP